MMSVSDFLALEVKSLVMNRPNVNGNESLDSESQSESQSQAWWKYVNLAANERRPKCMIVRSVDANAGKMVFNDKKYHIEAFVTPKIIASVMKKHNMRRSGNLRGTIVRVDMYRYALSKNVKFVKKSGSSGVPEHPTNRLCLIVEEMDIVFTDEIAARNLKNVCEDKYVMNELEKISEDELELRVAVRQGLPAPARRSTKHYDDAHPLLDEECEIDEAQERQLEAQEGWGVPPSISDSQLIRDNGDVPMSQSEGQSHSTTDSPMLKKERQRDYSQYNVYRQNEVVDLTGDYPLDDVEVGEIVEPITQPEILSQAYEDRETRKEREDDSEDTEDEDVNEVQSLEEDINDQLHTQPQESQHLREAEGITDETEEERIDEQYESVTTEVVDFTIEEEEEEEEEEAANKAERLDDSEEEAARPSKRRHKNSVAVESEDEVERQDGNEEEDESEEVFEDAIESQEEEKERVENQGQLRDKDESRFADGKQRAERHNNNVSGASEDEAEFVPWGEKEDEEEEESESDTERQEENKEQEEGEAQTKTSSGGAFGLFRKFIPSWNFNSPPSKAQQAAESTQETETTNVVRKKRRNVDARSAEEIKRRKVARVLQKVPFEIVERRDNERGQAATVRRTLQRENRDLDDRAGDTLVKMSSYLPPLHFDHVKHLISRLGRVQAEA